MIKNSVCVNILVVNVVVDPTPYYVNLSFAVFASENLLIKGKCLELKRLAGNRPPNGGFFI